MVNPAFSLTKQIVINPVLRMRAELLDDLEPSSGEKVWHVIEAEFFSRVTALFTSIFAAADAFVHFATGCYKGICLHVTLASWDTAEVGEHFRNAAFFACVTLVGSIAGFMWPGVFKYFRQTPSEPPSASDDIFQLLPKKIHDLSVRVMLGRIQAPFKQLKEFWHQSSLSGKHWFVQAFNRNEYAEFKPVREALADTVYRLITPSDERTVQWLNGPEVSQEVSWRADKIDIFSQAFFFHATSEKGLESILRTKRVEVRHEKLYRGAFVSTQPELGFGRYILAFKRNIERLSTLEHGFTIDKKTYWAGFSQNIPVSDNTLAYIILNSQDPKDRETLATQCEAWAKRKIHVISLEDVRSKLDSVNALHMGIAKEWPEEGEEVGKPILHAMMLAVKPETLYQQPLQLAITAQLQDQRRTREQQTYRTVAVPGPSILVQRYNIAQHVMQA